MNGSQIPPETPPPANAPSRRRWLHRRQGLIPFTILLACLAAGLVLAACGGGDSTSSSSTASSGAGGNTTTNAADTSDSGGAPSGTLAWSTTPPSSWDPVTSSAGGDIGNLALVYASLTRIGPEGDAEPAIATKWDYSKDGLTFNLTLRKGLKFTDGTPLDADAVKVNLLRGEKEADSLLIPFLEDIKSVKVVSPTQLSLSLSKPNYALPLVLGGKAGMIVSPKAIEDDPKGLASKPVGAGPFELTQYTPPTAATLVRNDGYWDADDIHLEGLDLKFFTNEQALLSSLLSGQVQVASIAGDQAKTAESAGFEVQEVQRLHVAYLNVNDSIAPFDDHKFIEAISYAIDRDALAQTLTNGHGEADDEIFPPGYSAYNDSVADYYKYDPEKAKELLKEANYDGEPITITVFAAPGLNYQVEAEQLQDQFKAVGIAADLESQPVAQAPELVYIKRTVAMTPNQFVGREAPGQTLETVYAANGLLNPGQDATPELTKALEEVGKHPIGTPEYDDALQNATKLGTEQGANIPLFTVPQLLAHTSAVTGLTSWIEAPRFEGVQLSE